MSKTPTMDRTYQLKTDLTTNPKGKQRLIVLTILREAKEPLHVTEIARLAEEAGLTATAGVKAFTRWSCSESRR
jgi:hypothetical protein